MDTLHIYIYHRSQLILMKTLLLLLIVANRNYECLISEPEEDLIIGEPSGFCD